MDRSAPRARRLPRVALPHRRKKMGVLTANVVFKPQSFGGATIVAEETVARLGARDDTEQVVFTTLDDPAAATYGLRRYEVGGIPAFAVRLPEFHRPDL